MAAPARTPQEFYRLATAAIVPRPIAWISTRGSDGVANLAPFSFFTVASIDPPVLCFTHINRRDGRDKDTLRNLREGGGCVVHTVSRRHAEAMNLSSGEYPPEVDELALAGLATCASASADADAGIAAPALSDAAVRFECRLREVISFGAQPMGGQMVLLDVVEVTLNPDLLDATGRIDPARLDAVGKMGGNVFCTTGERFELARP